MFLGGVGRLMRALASGTTFSPIDLFASGAPGVWYDPSDLSTMYQDAAGTTPVTAVEQPVGLRLDKSRGLVLGSELVTNGTFDANVNGWTSGPIASTPSWNAGEMTVTVTNANGRVQTTLSGLKVGGWYRLTATMRVVTPSGSSKAWIGASSTGLGVSQFLETSSTTNVTLTRGFFADATTMILVAGDNTTTSGAVFAFDNISVRELPGTHAFQTTDINRPVLSARYNLLTRTEEFDNAAWTKIAGGTGSAPVVTANAGLSPLGTLTADRVQYSRGAGTAVNDFTLLRQSVATSGACKWSVWLKSNDSNNYNVSIKYVGGASAIMTVTPTWTRFEFTATQATFECDIGLGSTSPGVSQSADILVWGADLRVSNDGVGLPAYQRVTGGTEGSGSGGPGTITYDTVGFPLYLRYNGTNSTMQTASIDFTSTDKMSVFSGVRKLSDAAVGAISELSATTLTNAGSFGVFSPRVNTTANYGTHLRGTARMEYITSSSFAAPLTNVLTAQYDISQATPELENRLRVNGVDQSLIVVDAQSGPAGTGNFGNYPLYLGARGGSSLWFNGRDYGLIVLGRTATATEIANTENYMEVKTFGKDMNYVYVDQVFAADGVTEITAADGDPIYMSVSYQ